MLPRLASARFGLLDDGVTVASARSLLADPSYLLRLTEESGRFLPAYWLFNTAVYWIAWDSPLAYFLANCALLAAAAALLAGFVRMRGGSRAQAAFSGGLFVLSGPVIESYYTLSKAEPIVVAAVLGALVLLLSGSSPPSTARRTARFAALTALLLWAASAKETALVMAPIALAWWAASALFRPDATDRMGRRERLLLLSASLTAAALYLAIRLAAPAGTAGYTANYQLEFGRIVHSGAVWLHWLVRDYPHLILLAAAAVVIPAGARAAGLRHKALLADSVIWMSGWTAVYLPWHSGLEYFLLPFSAGSAMFCGVVLGSLLDWVRENPASRSGRALLAAVVAAFAMTQANNLTAARYQIMVDAANARLVEALSALPAGSRILVNVPEPREYVFELGLHLSELHGRSDLKVDYFRFPVSSASLPAEFFVASPFLDRQLVPAPRHDVYASGARQWRMALEPFLRGNGALIAEIREPMQAFDFGIHRLACPLFGDAGLHCGVPRPLIDTRAVNYGWSLYRVAPGAPPALPAVFGADAVWRLAEHGGTVRRVAFGRPGDLPLAADFDGDGFTDLAVFDPSTLRWRVDTNRDGKPDAEFTVPGMSSADVPLAGDWAGRGAADPGFFRRPDAAFHLFVRRGANPEPFARLNFGLPGDQPLAGDWAGRGHAGIGVYRPSSGEVLLKHELSGDALPLSFSAGSGFQVVAARWTGGGWDSLLKVSGGRGEWIPPCRCDPANPPAPAPFPPDGGVPLGGRWGPR